MPLVGDGVTDNTAELQALLDAGDEVLLGVGTYNHTGLTLGQGARIRGASSFLSILANTDAGAALAATGTTERRYGWSLSNFQTTGSGVGVDMRRVSTSQITDVLSNGHTTGFLLGSVTAGHCVYNTFTNCTASSCGTGWMIGGLGANETRLVTCRANVCSVAGIDILDSNHATVVASSIEGCAIGVRVTSTTSSLSDATQVLFARFEGNTVNWNITSTNVRDTVIAWPSTVTGSGVDLGARSTIMDPRTSGSGIVVRGSDGAFRRIEAFPFGQTWSRPL